MFLMAFAWFQVTAAVPLVIHLLLTCRLTACFTILNTLLSNTIKRCHHTHSSPHNTCTSSRKTQTLQHDTHTTLSSCHVHTHHTPHSTLDVCDCDCNCNCGCEMKHCDECLLSSCCVSEAVRKFAKHHQVLRDVYGRLSQVLGPTIVFSHVFFVYTAIMTVFTLVFSFEVLLRAVSTVADSRQGCPKLQSV